MSEEASEIPMATFCTGNGLDGATLYSLVTHSNRGPKPRTHLANVIIRDNIMEKKMLELKLKNISKMQEKISSYNDNLKNKFGREQHMKSTRWKKEHTAFLKYVDKKKKSPNSLMSLSAQPPKLKK
ncbi:uncharacterized protein C5orf52 homolog [Engystomops pustulosus]|uniref:uncharacterized protein C5orf52 homolog n=1 Tax=Engystomops pustulosus TaxID=76066 RepID=UPI003AFB5E00